MMLMWKKKFNLKSSGKIIRVFTLSFALAAKLWKVFCQSIKSNNIGRVIEKYDIPWYYIFAASGIVAILSNLMDFMSRKARNQHFSRMYRVSA